MGNGVPNHQPHDCLLNLHSGVDQRKHQSSVSLAFVLEIHRWPVNSPHKWPVTRNMFPCDDVIMVPRIPWVYFVECIATTDTSPKQSYIGKSPATWLFVEYHFLVKSKENIKVPCNLRRESTENFPYTGPSNAESVTMFWLFCEDRWLYASWHNIAWNFQGDTTNLVWVTHNGNYRLLV